MRDMGCCDEQQKIKDYPLGVRQPGDVLVQAKWRGNRSEYGRGTGRAYPRMSFPKKTWVHPRDIDASPHLWQRIVEPMQDDSQYQFGETRKLAHAMVGGQEKPPAPPQVVVHEPDAVPLTPPQEGFHPNVERVIEVAKKKLKI